MPNYELISKLYDEGKSLREVADITKCPVTSICRLFKKNGKPLRDKVEAASLAVENGKILSPTEGKKRTEREKDKIASGLAGWWESMSEEDRESFKDVARERWNGISEQDKEERQRRAGEALRTAAVEGSKLEKFLYKYLTTEGYHVIMHKKGLIAGEKYEIDLYLPEQKIAIEIDGPHHFLPIFGESRLRQAIKYDNIKNGTLTSNGLCVIRVKLLLKGYSKYASKQISKMVLDEIKKIEKKFPSEKNRVIELETDDDNG